MGDKSALKRMKEVHQDSLQKPDPSKPSLVTNQTPPSANDAEDQPKEAKESTKDTSMLPKSIQYPKYWNDVFKHEIENKTYHNKMSQFIREAIAEKIIKHGGKL